ncbi:MAG: ATP-binding protein [Rhodomicrobium sp.]
MSTNGNYTGTPVNELEAHLAASIVKAQAQKAVGFHRAIKRDAKARVALDGISGGGKSYTMLVLATELARGGKIACVDTEHGSLSKYADLFQFDAAEPDSYTMDYLLSQLSYAEENGYAVFCVDSLSHFWMGKDGALEYVDNVKKRARDQMEGWKAFRPHERAMVDRFIASPCHIIVTMRVKTDYEEQVDSQGRKKRVKVGLAPVQREGLEYEFDLVCSMDEDNNLMVGKTRCPLYTEERRRVCARPGPEYFLPFIQWLNPTRQPVSLAKVEPAATLITPPVNQQGTEPIVQRVPWSNKAGMLEAFHALEARMPADLYFAVLTRHGIESPDGIITGKQGWACYKDLTAALEEHTRKAADPTTFENFQAEEGDWQ